MSPFCAHVSKDQYDEYATYKWKQGYEYAMEARFCILLERVG